MSEQAGGTLMLFSFERPRAFLVCGFSVDARGRKAPLAQAGQPAGLSLLIEITGKWRYGFIHAFHKIYLKF